MLLRVHTICLLLALASAITRSQAIVVPQQPVPIEACAARAVFPGAHPASVPASTADPGFDVTWYQLNLTISASQLAGAVTVKAHVVADTARTIALDLINAMQVDSVIVGGRRMPFSQFPASLLLTLDRGYARGELFTATVYYHGFPVPTGFGSFEFSGHAGTPWVWSLSEPYGARDWWPCKDVSTDKADSVDVIVTCSSALTVGSNGLMVSDIDHGDGTRTVHWSERYPIAPYLVSVALTNYAQFINWFHYSPTDSMEIINDVLPEHLASAKASLPNVVNMLEVFSRLYGEYPFIKEKYGHAIVDGVTVELGNYMAEPSSIFMGRGKHPLRGKWKDGATEEDITLNLSPDATRPAGPSPNCSLRRSGASNGSCSSRCRSLASKPKSRAGALTDFTICSVRAPRKNP